MRVAATSLVLFAACFSKPPPPGGSGPNDGAVDTTVTTDTPVDAPIDTLPGPCNPSGTSDVRMCFRFENDTQDLSGHANHAGGSGHVFVTGFSGIGIDASNATLQVPPADSLNVHRMTIRVHVKPAAVIPVGGTRQGLIENNAFRLHVMPGGGVRCALNAGSELNLATFTLSTTQFTRVACTYDGLNLRIYYDGSLMGVAVANVTINNVSTNTVLGQSEPADGNERFAGVIDNLEVFATLEDP